MITFLIGFVLGRDQGNIRRIRRAATVVMIIVLGFLIGIAMMIAGVA